MTVTSLAPFIYRLQNELNNFDLRQWASRVDLNHWVGQLDIKTVGGIAVAVLFVFLLLQVFAKPFVGPARSLVASAAHVWQDSQQALPPNHPARASRNLESVTQILDSLAEAAIKWEESNTIGLQGDANKNL